MLQFECQSGRGEEFRYHFRSPLDNVEMRGRLEELVTLHAVYCYGDWLLYGAVRWKELCSNHCHAREAWVHELIHQVYNHGVARPRAIIPLDFKRFSVSSLQGPNHRLPALRKLDREPAHKRLHVGISRYLLAVLDRVSLGKVKIRRIKGWRYGHLRIWMRVDNDSPKATRHVIYLSRKQRASWIPLLIRRQKVWPSLSQLLHATINQKSWHNSRPSPIRKWWRYSDCCVAKPFLLAARRFRISWINLRFTGSMDLQTSKGSQQTWQMQGKGRKTSDKSTQYFADCFFIKRQQTTFQVRLGIQRLLRRARNGLYQLWSGYDASQVQGYLFDRLISKQLWHKTFAKVHAYVELGDAHPPWSSLRKYLDGGISQGGKRRCDKTDGGRFSEKTCCFWRYQIWCLRVKGRWGKRGWSWKSITRESSAC